MLYVEKWNATFIKKIIQINMLINEINKSANRFLVKYSYVLYLSTMKLSFCMILMIIRIYYYYYYNNIILCT